MEEFEKIAEKQVTPKEVSERMAEFDKVAGASKRTGGDKTGTLPYGLKRYSPCPRCGEFMEIQEVKETAVYLCKGCNKISTVELHG
jgi:formamidopyrimidine-DNA glycosylase